MAYVFRALCVVFIQTLWNINSACVCIQAAGIFNCCISFIMSKL